MDKVYADTVRLLLSVAPDVFKSNAFSLKGGTAINLFVRDMPRLSVDIDLVFTQRELARNDALMVISKEIKTIKQRLTKRGLHVLSISPTEFGDCKLMINDGDIQVKVEVNHVFRGTVLPIERRSLVSRVSTEFSAELEVPVLAVDLLEVIGAWGPCKACASDLNGDNVVDINDLLEVIGAWGVCP